MTDKLVGGVIAIVLIVMTGVIANKNLNINSPSINAGSVSGPVSYSPFTTNNGVTKEYRAQRMSQGTTTVCALRAPTNATSTLVDGNVFFSVSSTTASTVTVAKATTAFATTTLLRTVSVGANAQATFPTASSTSVASTVAWALEQTNLTFAPGEYLVVGMAGGTGTFSPTGTCQAEFLSTVAN